MDAICLDIPVKLEARKIDEDGLPLGVIRDGETMGTIDKLETITSHYIKKHSLLNDYPTFQFVNSEFSCIYLKPEVPKLESLNLDIPKLGISKNSPASISKSRNLQFLIL